MKKILTLVACLSLVASLAIGGSIAYLTSTDTEVNTFTIGDVEIDIVEEGFVQGSTLNPGTTVNKNAEIKNTGKNDAWVWMTVAIEPAALKDALTLTYENDANWDTETIPGVQLYKNVLKAGANGVAGDTTGIRLKSVSLASNVDVVGDNLVKVVNGVQTVICSVSDLDNLKVTVNAFGIQTEGFSSAAYAYNGYQGQWGGTTVELPELVSSTEELAAALSAGKTKIQLADGDYTMPDVAKGKTFSVTGSRNAVINVVPSGQGEGNGQLDYSLDGSNVTFNGVTIKTNSQLYAGFARLSATYNDCVIQNTYNLGTGTSKFNNCEINITNEYLRVGGASNAEFIGCTFNTDGRAILVFQDGTSVAQTVTVKDCTFNATAAAQTWNGIHVAAVSIDGSQGGTYVVNLEGTNVVDSDFNGLWQIKAGETNVTVNE